MELKDNDNVIGGLDLLMHDVCSHDETMGDAAVLQERVTMLERLLEEKERLIKVLMER